MILKNARVFLEGQFKKVDLKIKNGVVAKIGPELIGEDYIDCSGKMIWPGLFDIHTHGCLGYDFSNCNVEEMHSMCRFYIEHGVTDILATTMTNEPQLYQQAMCNIAAVREQQRKASCFNEAFIQGIHMEGPFFGKERKGAHDEKYLSGVSQELLDHYQALSQGAIRLLDLYPNLKGALSFINHNKEKYIISIAHTNCTYELAQQAVKAGASHVTHLFNAMRPMLSREPGVIGAASEFGLLTEMICDGIHIHPAVIHLMFRAMPKQMILISDSINPTGLSDGEYMAGGLLVHVFNQRAVLEDGTLAGSVITLFDAVKNAVKFHVPLEAALLSATYVPACSVGLEHQIGSIKEGRDANLLLVDEQLNLLKVFKCGKEL